MFKIRKKGKSSNLFVERMKLSMKASIEGRSSTSACAKEIVPILKAFFKTSMTANIPWDGQGVCYNVENIAEIAEHLAGNTRSYENLSSEDLSSIEKIFDELYALHYEAINYSDQADELSKKISCINAIMLKNMAETVKPCNRHKNWRNALTFKNYNSLWVMIHRINNEWKELCSRGFSITVLDNYWESVEYAQIITPEKSEDEYLNDFMGLLDGTKKFVPAYEERAVCFAVVDMDFKNKIIHNIKNGYNNSYSLPPKTD